MKHYLTSLIFISVGFSPMSENMGMAQMIVAHRGASHDAPENTLAAFQEAWHQNADGIEGDFYLTKDQQIVCIHDADTARTAGKKLDVAKSTLSELRELEYGSWKNKQFRGEPLPTFAEVLATVPAGKRFVIELKTGPEIVPFLKSELDRLKPSGIEMLMIAFKKETVAAVKQELPEIPVHWLTGFKQDTVTRKWEPTLQQIVSTLKETKADGLGAKGVREVLTADFIARLRSEGLKEFHVWTIDRPDDARYFQELGAIGITTNRPALIRAAIEKE